MPEFDADKAYAPQEETIFFDDGREEEVVDYVTTHPKKDYIRGSPERVLRVMDQYGQTKKFLMNVGEDKGDIIADLIRERKPQVMVEFGGYCGYSAILFGAALREAGGKRYFSMERSTKFATVITRLVDFAGLGDIVKVVVGPGNNGIKSLHAGGGLDTIDMLFLDHYKPAYTADLKLCEHLQMFKKGTVIIANNVISPGNPPYLDYVRSSVEDKRTKFIQGSKVNTADFSKHTITQYGKVEDLNNDALGNPNLIYESSLIHSFEPTGIPDGLEITKCLGESNP